MSWVAVREETQFGAHRATSSNVLVAREPSNLVGYRKCDLVLVARELSDLVGPTWASEAHTRSNDSWATSNIGSAHAGEKGPHWKLGAHVGLVWRRFRHGRKTWKAKVEFVRVLQKADGKGRVKLYYHLTTLTDLPLPLKYSDFMV